MTAALSKPASSRSAPGSSATPVAHPTAYDANLAPRLVKWGATTRATGVGDADVGVAGSAPLARAPSTTSPSTSSSPEPARRAAAAAATDAPEATVAAADTSHSDADTREAAAHVTTVAAMRTSTARENLRMAPGRRASTVVLAFER